MHIYLFKSKNGYVLLVNGYGVLCSISKWICQYLSIAWISIDIYRYPYIRKLLIIRCANMKKMNPTL